MSLTARSEDERNHYQQRLALTYQVGLALSSAFLAVQLVARGLVEGGLRAALQTRWFLVAATIVLGSVWWLLRRARVSFRILHFADTGLILFLTVLFAISAGMYEIRAVSVYQLAVVTGFVAMIRAIVVPSTAVRTLTLGLAQAAIATTIFVLSAFHPGWPVLQRGYEEWPFPYQLTAFSLWLGGLIALATVASRIIYRLRREVRAFRKLGQYDLGDKLGEGGMGVVYRATHAMLRRATALKLLPPDRVDPATIRRFEREVVETARLTHPNTVAIYDYGRTPDGVFYYAMEYLDGVDIGELVERDGPLPPGARRPPARAGLRLARRGARARPRAPRHQARERHGHRQAVRVRLVKVLDFGLVKSRAPFRAASRSRTPTSSRGRRSTWRPRSIAGPDAAEPRSDLYAVAALGYYMLTGQHVFAARTAIEIYAAHLHTAPVPPHERLGRELPPDLEALILRGLAKSPADRPQNAAAFRGALLHCAVPAWTEADARAWWMTHGERLRRREAVRSTGVAFPPTVTVARDRLYG